jgi:hypothetical protein
MMYLNLALGLGAITLVQAAGYFFKLNKNLVQGASTLIVMLGMWYGVTTAREEAIMQKHDSTAIGSKIPAPQPQPQ